MFFSAYWYHIDVHLRRTEAHIELNFNFGPSIDVFNHFKAVNNTKMRLF